MLLFTSEIRGTVVKAGTAQYAGYLNARRRLQRTRGE